MPGGYAWCAASFSRMRRSHRAWQRPKELLGRRSPTDSMGSQSQLLRFTAGQFVMLRAAPLPRTSQPPLVINE